MAITEAQARATRKYQDRVYKRVSLVIPKELNGMLEERLKKTGETKNRFFTRLVEEELDRIKKGEK